MKCTFIVLFILLLTGNSTAQLKPSVAFPVTPEVAALAKFADTPVGTYSGVPDISIPLYEIKYKFISIPLTLSYHAGGIKVDEEASWVGLGWDIFSGGLVSRSVVGDREDNLDYNYRDVPAGWNEFNARFGSATFVSGVGNLNYWSAWGCVGYDAQGLRERSIMKLFARGWGEPDVFSFSFLGHSGKFVIDPFSLEPMILDKKEEMKIIRTGTSFESGWKIKTADGLEFTFSMYGYSRPGSSIASQTWKLVRIKGYDGSEVTFDYQPVITQGASVSETLHSDFFGGAIDSGPYNKTVSVTDVHDFYLTKITTPTETIEFSLDSRMDIRNVGNTSRRLKEILVKDKLSGAIKKVFEFGYDYFTHLEGAARGNSFIPISDVALKRLKLVSVREAGIKGGARVYNPPYTFFYNPMLFPPKTSFAMDYWGYYNGAMSNSTMLPDLVPIYAGQSGIDDIPFQMLQSQYRANRAASIPHMQLGMLERINYPTGGYKKFYYEPNRFSNFTYYANGQANIVTRSAFAEDQNFAWSASDTIDYLPVASKTVKANVTITFTPGSPPLDMSSCYSRLCKLVNGQLQQVKLWPPGVILPGGVRPPVKDSLQLEAGIQYVIQACMPNYMINTPGIGSTRVSASIQFKEIVVTGSPESIGCGLRIAKVESGGVPGEVDFVKTYEYTNASGQTTGKLLSPPMFLSWASKKAITGCVEYALKPKVWSLTSGSNISLRLSANSGYVGYSSVKVVERSSKDQNEINSIVVTDFINENNFIGGPNIPEDPRLDNGLPIKTTWLDKNGLLQKEEISTYVCEEIHQKFIYGYAFYEEYVNFNGCETCIRLGDHHQTVTRYLIKSRFFKLRSRVTKEKVGNNVLVNTTLYRYNPTGLVTQEKTINSAGDTLKNEMKYPVDYALLGEPYPYQIVSALRDSFYFPPIEQKKIFNNNVLTKTLNTYGSPIAGKYLPVAVQLANGTGKVLDYINYTSFSSLTSNPKVFIGKSGVNTVIVWGRNGTVPIAKIEGATLAQVNSKINSAIIETMATASVRTELLKLYTLTNCFVQLFIYNDKGELIELIDPSKTSTYFEYDALGRFSLARDHNRNIIANYQYQYRN